MVKPPRTRPAVAELFLWFFRACPGKL